MSVEFIDTSQETIKALTKLAKTALKAGGQVAKQKLTDNTKVRSARLQKATHSAVKINSKTGQPTLQIGYMSKYKAKKVNGKTYMANPYWLEFGVKSHEIQAGVLSSRGKVRKQTGKRILTDGVHDFGSKVFHPGYSGKNTLKNTIMNNIDEIRKAEEEGLSKLNLELEKLSSYIDESEDDIDE
jgi:hypothetical protein